jgi:hypothetical protein
MDAMVCRQKVCHFPCPWAYSPHLRGVWLVRGVCLPPPASDGFVQPAYVAHCGFQTLANFGGLCAMRACPTMSSAFVSGGRQLQNKWGPCGPGISWLVSCLLAWVPLPVLPTLHTRQGAMLPCSASWVKHFFFFFLRAVSRVAVGPKKQLIKTRPNYGFSRIRPPAEALLPWLEGGEGRC